jgi:hypothetical protein
MHDGRGKNINEWKLQQYNKVTRLSKNDLLVEGKVIVKLGGRCREDATQVPGREENWPPSQTTGLRASQLAVTLHSERKRPNCQGRRWQGNYTR